MDDAIFQTRFNELLAGIRDLPSDQRARLEALAEETRQRHLETRDAVDRAHTALERLTLTLQLSLLQP